MQCGWEEGGPQVGVGLITSPRALTSCPGGRDVVRKAPAARGRARRTCSQLQKEHTGLPPPRFPRDHRELALRGCGRTGGAGEVPAGHCRRTGAQSRARSHWAVPRADSSQGGAFLLLRPHPHPTGGTCTAGTGRGGLGAGLGQGETGTSNFHLIHYCLVRFPFKQMLLSRSLFKLLYCITTINKGFTGAHRGVGTWSAPGGVLATPTPRGLNLPGQH